MITPPFIIEYKDSKYLVDNDTVDTRLMGRYVILQLGDSITITLNPIDRTSNISTFTIFTEYPVFEEDIHKIKVNKYSLSLKKFIDINLMTHDSSGGRGRGPLPYNKSSELYNYIIEYMSRDYRFNIYYDKDDIDLLRMEKSIIN